MARSRAVKQVMQKNNPDKWIQKAINPANKGDLHKALNVPEDQKIPESKLKKAEHSKNSTLRKRANLDETLRGFYG